MEKQESMISAKELEKELATAKVIKTQIENTWQQIIGRIECLETLIKKAKGEEKSEENTKKD